MPKASAKAVAGVLCFAVGGAFILSMIAVLDPIGQCASLITGDTSERLGAGAAFSYCLGILAGSRMFYWGTLCFQKGAQ